MNDGKKAKQTEDKADDSEVETSEGEGSEYDKEG